MIEIIICECRVNSVIDFDNNTFSCLRFYDNNTGQMVHSMVAHLDSVTSLAVDQHGLYLISGSHDCSIR